MQCDPRLLFIGSVAREALFSENGANLSTKIDFDGRSGICERPAHYSERENDGADARIGNNRSRKCAAIKKGRVEEWLQFGVLVRQEDYRTQYPVHIGTAQLYQQSTKTLKPKGARILEQEKKD